jgi:preprotein translocase subunit SecF
MSLLRAVYRGETRFDFIGASRRVMLASAGLIVLSIVLLVVRPLNLSIDFTGGTILTVANPAEVTVSEVRGALSGIGQGGATVQITGEGFILVRTEALSAADQDELVATVAEVAEADLDEVNVDAVGPTFGTEVTRRAIEALAIFLVAVVIFISWRFEWKMALAALAALFHDLLITAGIYTAVGFVVTPATVIAVLTILGYSLYDTVVVFDKVTENVHELHAKSTYTDIVNLSMNQVLMRSINTSLTSLLPVGSLLFVGSLVLGAETLQEFALALFIGMAVGTYSSIYVASPLLALWKERETEWERARVRAARRRGDAGAAVADQVTATVTPATPGVAAKPPKQRRKRR